MGRPKKPANVHKGQGTYQPCRHGGPNLPVQIPDMPPDMGPAAQACWKQVTVELERAGLVGEIDQKALRLLCEEWEIYLEALDAIRDKGIVITNINKNGSVTVINPAVRIRADVAKRIITLLKNFGMTPSARTGINFADAEDGSSEEDKVLRIVSAG